MKKQIFYPAFALLLFANLFVFCTKESSSHLTQIATESSESDASFDDFSLDLGIAEDRGGSACCVFISSPNCDVKVCGTQENTNTCTPCPGWVTLTGTEGPSNYVDFCLPNSAYFAIKNGASTDCVVWVGNTPVALVAYTIPANSTRRFKSDAGNNCAITAGSSCSN